MRKPANHRKVISERHLLQATFTPPEKALIRSGTTSPVDALWDYFMALPWEVALPVLEELYELDEPVHYISWVFAVDSQKELYRHAQVPKDYIRLFLLHVMVTRILRPDAEVDLRLVRVVGPGA